MVVSDPDSEEDDDEDVVEKRHSSDSDEDELLSLQRIHQLPEMAVGSRPMNTEDMDVTPADGTAQIFFISITIIMIVPVSFSFIHHPHQLSYQINSV